MTKFLAKIYLILTLDCEASAKLTSDSLDRELDWSELWAGRLHRLICGKSRRLDKQILALNRALHMSGTAGTEIADLPVAAKDRIRQRLKNLGSRPD